VRLSEKWVAVNAGDSVELVTESGEIVAVVPRTGRTVEFVIGGTHYWSSWDGESVTIEVRYAGKEHLWLGV
jgi:hypothetical protein